MPKIDLATVPARKGSGYPAPFRAHAPTASGSGSAMPEASRISAST
ncbi:hypothetical protein SAMN05216338_104311 [Bradyrhizobium sp. Rc2d]|nr:hypothetical protein SAMN05216338_104311 [Bradyrhizobium sp. Rc2d]